MILADTGAVIALIDKDDRNHQPLHELFVSDPVRWVLPWAILPEVDYLLAEHIGREVEEMFVRDLGAGSWQVEWGTRADLQRANELLRQYAELEIGLVDAVVIAIAERLRVEAIATLDLHAFAEVEIIGSPRLIPRDL
jgi:uncharacterized protein